MTDNRPEYGFRPFKPIGGRDNPVPVECVVSTAQSFDVSGGASNCGLGAGDLVVRDSTGGVILCGGEELGAGSAVAPFGVVIGVKPYYDANTGRMTYSSVLPSDVAWGTVMDRQSKVLVVPVDWFLWEVDVDDTVTASTLAAYQAMVGCNVNHINTATSGMTRPTPKLDISNTATTSSFAWRIQAVSPTQNNQDFSGANVKLVVEANIAQRPGRGTPTGI